MTPGPGSQPKARRSQSAVRDAVHPSWRRVADAVGHCVLVFAFVPALAPLPGWLVFEATNPLNVQDPIVLSFVLVRGINLLLNAFFAGIVPGVLAGTIEGALLCGWPSTRAPASTRRQRCMVGAVSGALAAGLMVLAVMAGEAFVRRPRTWAGGAIAFEVISGVVCGMLAAPTAIRLLARDERYPDGTSVSASQ